MSTTAPTSPLKPRRRVATVAVTKAEGPPDKVPPEEVPTGPDDPANPEPTGEPGPDSDIPMPVDDEEQAVLEEVVQKYALEGSYGTHGHGLIRENKRTQDDGAHSHLFVVPGQDSFWTLADGGHYHALDSEAALETERSGKHAHEVLMPDGTRLRTSEDGSEHSHAALYDQTSICGAHQHTLRLPDGTVLTSSTGGGQWVANGRPPQRFYGPMATRSPRAPSAFAPSRLRLEKRAEIIAIEKLIKPFRSPGGKTGLVDELLARVPAHKTYVEPYAGSATLLFAKEKSEREILVERDPDVVAFLKFVKNANSDDFEWLRKQDFSQDETRFEALRKSTPKSVREQAYRFKYINLHSVRGGGQYLDKSDRAQGATARVFLANLEKMQERLKDVEIERGDALAAIAKHDAPDTFFYVDPPWSGTHKNSLGTTQANDKFRAGFEPEKLQAALKGIKGKALVSFQGPFAVDGFKKRTVTQKASGIRAEAQQQLYFNFERDVSMKRALVQKTCGGFPVLCTVCKAGPVTEEVWWNEAEANLDVCSDCADVFVPKAIETVSPEVDVTTHAGWSTVLGVTKRATDFALIEKAIEVDKEEREVLGIVLEPDEVDAQNDTIKASVIRSAAHDFLARFGKESHLGVMHKRFGDVGLQLLQSWVTENVEKYGNETVKKGSWLMRVKVVSDELWKQIKSGAMTGFSIGGIAGVIAPPPKT